MEDWKSKLSALTGVPVPEVTETIYEEDDDKIQTLPKKQQKLRLAMERAGRGGKTVTIIRGFVGSEEDMNELCKLLKQKCGVGGTAKDGEIIIQGDHRPRLLEILKNEGYTQSK
ncbi:MAG: translation initiation factor [Bacteroidaceae bacterium]|nr:translation initiation factor [Bacteroidaceae bacterium]